MADGGKSGGDKAKPKAGALLKFMLPVQTFVVGALLAIFYGGYYYCDCIPVPASLDLATRVAFTLRWPDSQLS